MLFSHFNVPFWKAFFSDFNRFHYFWNNWRERSEMTTSELGGRKATDSHGIVRASSYQQIEGRTRKQGGGFQKQPASLPFSALNVHHWVFDGEEKLGYIVKGSRGVVSSSFFKTRTPAPFAMLPFLKNKVCLVRDVSRPISPHLQLPATHQNSQCQHASQHAHTLI